MLSLAFYNNTKVWGCNSELAFLKPPPAKTLLVSFFSGPCQTREISISIYPQSRCLHYLESATWHTHEHAHIYCSVWLESNLHCTKNRWAWSQLCGSHVLCMLVLIVIAIYILHNVQGFISAMFICTCTVLVALASTIIILLCSKVTSIYHGGCMVLPWSIPCNVEKLDVAPIGRRLYNVENA